MTWLDLKSRAESVKLYVTPACGNTDNRVQASAGTRAVEPEEVSELTKSRHTCPINGCCAGYARGNVRLLQMRPMNDMA